MVTAKVCVCLVLVILCSVIGIFGDSTVTIKGLYCKDPNDNTFHPVNSTWRSSTFCGNYTCRIRKKNNTTPLVDSAESSPVINPIDKPDDDQDLAGSEHYSIKENKHDTNRNNIELNDKNALKRDEAIKRFEDNIIASLGEKEDRYLNTAEINSITDMLHTVKRSDLEAILEVYTLAKDIFNEIDETTMEKIVEKENSKIVPAETEYGPYSYFYDPYTATQQNNKEQRDLKDEASNRMNAVVPRPTYNAPFLRHYNDKLAEYYPMSDFHRTSSYYNPSDFHRSSSYYNPFVPAQPQSTAPTNTTQKPELKPNGSCCSPNTLNPFIASYIAERKTKPQFMPYPVTYILKNSVPYPYDTNPWVQPYMNPLAFSPANHFRQGYANMPQTPPRQIKEHHTDILEEIYGAPHKSNLIEKLVPTVEVNKPSWQTGQLSPEIIDDVRANILQKTEKILNIIPRKKIKLERVAKVLKIDELARSKREAADKKEELKKTEDDEPLEEYEAFIEKSTCGPSIEPGYFRVGNMSQPFPLCCPEKIEKR